MAEVARKPDAAPAKAAPASLREQRTERAAQARWLTAQASEGAGVASSTTLAAIGWDDLGQLPDWVTADPASTARLIAHVGAWAQAPRLRHCIDGRVLAAVRTRIGDAAFVALMTEAIADGPASGEAMVAPEGVEATLAAMDQRARAVLLGSIAQSALREAVRERLWPDAPPLLHLDAAADAQALIERARAHLEPQEVTA